MRQLRPRRRLPSVPGGGASVSVLSSRRYLIAPPPPVPTLNFCFPVPLAEASQASPLRVRILLKPQKGDGFYRPRTRTGRKLMSLCCSCHLEWGSRGRVPIPRRLRVLEPTLQPCREDCPGEQALTHPVPPRPTRGPQNLVVSSIAITISGSYGVACGLISAKVYAKMWSLRCRNLYT